MKSHDLTVTEDVNECPGCGGPVVKTSDRDRACWTCVIQWTVVRPGDEKEAEELRKLNGRESATGTRIPLPGSIQSEDFEL